MAQVNVSDLTGKALDWAVAKVVGQKLIKDTNGKVFTTPYGSNVVCADVDWTVYTPSTDWAQGGKVITTNKITIVCCEGNFGYENACWETFWLADIGAQIAETVFHSDGYRLIDCYQIEHGSITGDTPLIAAMRCLVASKLGGIIEVPEELLK